MGEYEILFFHSLNFPDPANFARMKYPHELDLDYAESNQMLFIYMFVVVVRLMISTFFELDEFFSTFTYFALMNSFAVPFGRFSSQLRVHPLQCMIQV